MRTLYAPYTGETYNLLSSTSAVVAEAEDGKEIAVEKSIYYHSPILLCNQWPKTCQCWKMISDSIIGKMGLFLYPLRGGHAKRPSYSNL